MSEIKEVSAVEWFANKLDEIIPYIDEETAREFNELLAEANKMFEKQIVESFKHGELPPLFTNLTAQQYYNETYGKKNKQ